MSLSRRYRRNISAARDLARKRRHGAPRTTGGLGMRPPGCGAVAYPGSPERNLRVSRIMSGVDAVTAALADGVPGV
jgi:hypothetical protein